KPWTLDPSNPSAPAASGDNYLDNVDKIEFMNPIPRRYRVRVYLKNPLQNASHAYSLIFTGSSIHSPEHVAYWIPGSGQFQGQNWSTISGGSIDAGLSPTDKTIVFDHNSQLVENDVITLNQSLTVKNFIWNSFSNAILDLGGNTLTIENDFFVSN